MGRMYTLDNKLLCGSPEVRIGERVYPIDDRQKTVKKAMKLFEDIKSGGDSDTQSSNDFDKLDELFKLAFGANYKEIEEKELSFLAYNELAGIVLAAMTGEEEKEYKSKKDNKNQSFPDGED